MNQINLKRLLSTNVISKFVESCQSVVTVKLNKNLKVQGNEHHTHLQGTACGMHIPPCSAVESRSHSQGISYFGQLACRLKCWQRFHNPPGLRR